MTTRPAGIPTPIRIVSHSAAGFERQRRLDFLRQRGSMPLAILAVREPRIADEVLAPDHFRERLELLLLVRRDVEETARRS